MVRTHIVVGGGSSGLALTKKLLEEDNVILIERGDVDQGEAPRPNPSFMEKIFNIYPQLSIWCYRAFALETTSREFTKPQKCLADRQICYAQGYGLGGSGGVNAMIYTLGNSLVYDQQWPKEWNAKRVEGSLRTTLGVEHSPSVVHTSGNMESIYGTHDELQHIASQYVYFMDRNAFVPSYYTTVHKHGTSRINQAHKSLTPSKQKKGKLTVISNCSVLEVQFYGNTATGLLVSRRVPAVHGHRWEKQTVTPSHGGEIILCAGAFESPRVLLASGLRRAESRTASTPYTPYTPFTSHSLSFSDADSPLTPLSPLPNLVDIGQNLQDHCVLPYMMLGNWYRNWRIFHAKGTPHYAGKEAYPLNGIHGWINLAADGSVWDKNSNSPPCVQLLFIDGRVSASMLPLMLPKFASRGVYSTYIYPVLFGVLKYLSNLAVVRWACGYFFGILVCLTQPKSRGRLHVNKADPEGPLIIDPNYLADPADMEALHNGFRTARQLISRAATRPGGLTCLEVFPGPLFAYASTRKWFESYARMLVSPYFHACGTCAMVGSRGEGHGNEGDVGVSSGGGAQVGVGIADTESDSIRSGVSGGVVGVDFKVRGVNKLRVADASVIPAIPSSPTQALCMVLGDACGQLILKEM